MQDVIRLFYPGAEITGAGAEADLHLEVETTVRNGCRLAARAAGGGEPLEQVEEKVFPEPGAADVENELKRLAQLAVYRLLRRLTGSEPGPWGIFTGVRPTKIVHRLMDRGLRRDELVARLTADFAVREDRARLIAGIAGRQRPYLPPPEGRTAVGVYIGIPFCPTRCLYCSFPSYPLAGYRSRVEPFCEALLREIAAVGAALAGRGIPVQHIYMGGGTPTSLPPELFRKVLQAVRRHLYGPQTEEFTVEGGRPDTLTREKLEACASAGANRISINPQTMHDRTLRAIGRSHTVADIFRAAELAGETGFPVVNTDVIIGLPGETAADVAETMRLLGELAPENITVHALAVKRASQLRFELDNHNLPGPAEATAMWETAFRAAAGMGMQPYYLYRQKKTAGNLENTGYALPGKECLYNIAVIEERQTILGLGAGAGTKWVHPGDWYLTARYNPKDPWVYVDRIEEIIANKLSGIASLPGQN
ncbi:MAG: coproporphyrinogen dehydrogenase HemZ [Firmicutes bacterium]|nr:coproporphyrinogen dehydrogenase HemZ [Bacillota bacterium]